MRQEPSKKKELVQFDEELFSAIIKQITIYMDGRIIVEFINGITIYGQKSAVWRCENRLKNGAKATCKNSPTLKKNHCIMQ